MRVRGKAGYVTSLEFVTDRGTYVTSASELIDVQLRCSFSTRVESFDTVSTTVHTTAAVDGGVLYRQDQRLETRPVEPESLSQFVEALEAARGEREARLARAHAGDMKDANRGIAFGGTAVGNLLGVVLVALLMSALGVEGWLAGLAFGAIVGLIFRGGAHAIHNGFAGRRPGVTLIDLAHDTIGLGLAAAVLGAIG